MIQKILDYFKSLSPANTPAEIEAQGSVRPTQERILQTTLLFTSLFAVLMFIFVVPALLRDGQNLGAFFLSIFGAAFIILTLWRKSAYGLKAQLLIVTLFLLSIISFAQSGFNASSGVILFCYITFTTVLFGANAGWRSILLSAGSLGLIWLGFKSQIFTAPVYALDATASVNWLLFGILLVVLLGLSVSAVGVVLNALSANLEKVRFFSTNLEDEQNKVATLLEKNTTRLERRETQLRTASQISRDFSTMLDPKELLEKVVNSVRENFDLYYVGIFLVDEDGRYAVLSAGTGEAGEKMIEANHRLEVGGASMIGWCVSNRKARIALDVGAEQVRFNNPYLPLTRSEMALPIVFQDRSIGAMTIQSVEPRAFVEEDILILQGIADSLAIALENAKLFQNTQQALEELRVYNQTYIQDTWGRTLAAQGDLSFSYQNQSVRSAENDLRELSIPVTLRDQKIGEISIETANDTLNTDDRAFLDAILTQTALALENARLLEETQRRAIQEQKLNDLSTQLSKASSIEYILQTAARELGQLPMVSEVSVQLVSPSNPPTVAIPGSNGNGHNGNGHDGKEQ